MIADVAVMVIADVAVIVAVCFSRPVRISIWIQDAKNCERVLYLWRKHHARFWAVGDAWAAATVRQQQQ